MPAHQEARLRRCQDAGLPFAGLPGLVARLRRGADGTLHGPACRSVNQHSTPVDVTVVELLAHCRAGDRHATGCHLADGLDPWARDYLAAVDEQVLWLEQTRSLLAENKVTEALAARARPVLVRALTIGSTDGLLTGGVPLADADAAWLARCTAGADAALDDALSVLPGVDRTARLTTLLALLVQMVDANLDDVDPGSVLAAAAHVAVQASRAVLDADRFDEERALAKLHTRGVKGIFGAAGWGRTALARAAVVQPKPVRAQPSPRLVAFRVGLDLNVAGDALAGIALAALVLAGGQLLLPGERRTGSFARTGFVVVSGELAQTASALASRDHRRWLPPGQHGPTQSYFVADLGPVEDDSDAVLVTALRLWQAESGTRMGPRPALLAARGIHS